MPDWSDAHTGEDKLRAVIARQLEQVMAEKRWEPLAHQVPPVGDWLGWLLVAGRGAGKSAAASHYVVDHVHGPPCIPGPTPHWMAIIAPTLGDAATSCYSGPAGIRSFDPDAVMGQKIGGQVITWPNGSQAKMYGAREPDDVERLRAGGNTSLSAGTLVKTSRGDVAIEQVQVGELVQTRHGLRRVLWAGQTGVKPLLELTTTDGRVLRLTADHEVWSGGRWIEAGDLMPNDTLTTWASSSTTAHAGMSGQKLGTTPTHGVRRHCCTATSGRSITDRSHHEPSCITVIQTIRRPLTSPDLSSSGHRANTSNINIVDQLTGIGSVVSLPGVTSNRPYASASGVAVPTSVVRPAASHAAQPAATRQLRHAHVNGGCVACAVVSSPPNNDQPPRLARTSVARVTSLTGEQAVYDLMVEHDHEFFANGVLVANCLAWLEEMAAWRYMEDAWDQIRFGLRLGSTPRWVGTTTPKPRPLIKRLVKGEFRRVVLGTATTYDNPHLPQHIKDALEEAYQGTSLGSQELLGRLVEQDENALWTREIIELNRVPAQEDLQRIAVGVDPSGGAGEQGIVVIGCQTQLTTVTTSPEAPPRLLKHGYVLDDRTVHLQPAGWGRAAVQAAVDWDADAVVVETNFGGDMAVSTIVTAAEDMGIHVPVKTVRASRGKHPRAQPVSALAVQRRWHHAGTFLALEDQLCTWTEDADWSPDRLDAMAWPAWYLKMISTVVKQVGTFGGSDLVRRTIGRRRSS